MSARNAALDRARTGLTVLVVIHHAVIPYTYYGYADTHRWLGFDGIILATDSFFMALFFLLSGLFVWPSLQRKSVANFLHDRLLRLMNLNFVESNPIPVKASMALMGLCEEVFRLPMVPPAEATREALRGALRELGLLP